MTPPGSLSIPVATMTHLTLATMTPPDSLPIPVATMTPPDTSH